VRGNRGGCNRGERSVRVNDWKSREIAHSSYGDFNSLNPPSDFSNDIEFASSANKFKFYFNLKDSLIIIRSHDRAVDIHTAMHKLAYSLN